jgi:hypothetical protein
MPSGESWTALRRFCSGRGDVEIRLSELVQESAWLPMPDEVFERVRDAMKMDIASGKSVVLLGMPGYLALLTEENKRAAMAALREWVDNASGRASVCLLRGDEGTKAIINDVFTNPRYRQGKQLIEIEMEQIVPQCTSVRPACVTDTPAPENGTAGRTEVMLVGADLASYIPEACDTFQKYLRYTEDHPDNNSPRRIVVTSEGRELAGLSAEVRQVVWLRDFARVFYDVDDAGLSEDALRWLCGRGKGGAEVKLLETLKKLFFPEGGITKHVLRVFDTRKGAEREVTFWLAKHVAPSGSYLKCVMEQEGVTSANFRSAYVTGAAAGLDEAMVYAAERRDAIWEANVIMSGVDINHFIELCAGETTARVAPWLNCGSGSERGELLRRCALDGVVSNAVKDVYPEVAAYLNADTIFSDETLERYFKEYRDLKMVGRVTSEFYVKAERVAPATAVQPRDAMVQMYAADDGCALLVVDAMGAEWLPMLVASARERNLGVDSLAVCMAHLPTTTQCNNIHWPDKARRLPDIKRFDNIAHNGVEKHESRSSEENLAASLAVIGSEVLPHVAEGLARFERVLLTADHGSSRLAALAWLSEPRLARTLACEEGAEVADWRYRESAAQGGCPPEMEETLDGRHWVVRGYDRLPKKGGGQGFELHGGGTLEERLVPVVLFSRTGQFVPRAKAFGKKAQIVEKDDFDL